MMTTPFRWLGAAMLLAAIASSQPLRQHPRNPRYFEHKGRTVVLVTSAEHYGSVVNGGFDYRKYLDTLAREGMNYTRIFGGSYVEIPAKSFGILRNTLAPEPGKLVSPWKQDTATGKFQLDQWNDAYFARLKDFLTEAEKRGIFVELTLFSSHYQPAHWLISPLHPDRNINNTTPLDDYKKLHTTGNGNILSHQERYVRKLVRETNGFSNLFYEIQNEPWSDRPVLSGVVNRYLQGQARDRYPNSIDLADAQSVAWQKLVAQWIVSEESALPNKHLIAQNHSNFGLPVRPQDIAPGVSIVNFHYAYPFAASANLGLGKVLGHDETGFMARNTADGGTAAADAAYLREAWNFLLSGGGLFNGLDYSFTTGKEDGTDLAPNGPGGGSPALRRGLRILREFLESLPLDQMNPNTGVVAHGNGAYVRALAGKDAYALYLDGPSESVSLRLPAGSYVAQWMNPETGAWLPDLQVKITAAVADVARPAGASVLRLRKK
jgi:hypothetical protein